MTSVPVVLVEDNDGDALIIQELLEGSRPPFDQLELHRARSMSEYRSLVGDLQPSCVLLDLGLPDANGTSAVTDAADAAPDVPIVVLTGSDDPDLARQALLAGAQDYLVKGDRLTEDGTRRSIRYAIDRSAQTRELRASRIEFRDFAHRVAHDLKSPLAVILGLLDLLTMRKSDDDQDQELFAMADRSGRRLVDMVDRLLEYAESAGADRSLEDVDLDAVMSWVTSTLDQQLAEVELDIQHPLPSVHANETGLRHVFLNLVSNSVKFADPDRPLAIALRAEDDGEHVRIELADNGRGIDPEHRAMVFDLGGRAHADQPGTGLGLATVRRTVELSGGQVEIDDGPDGRGTTIRLLLRRAE